MKLAHLTDIHFGGENPKAVAAAAEQLRDDPPDAVVLTGDLTRQGDRKEFRAAKAWAETLPGPVFVVPGNHDTPYFDPIARLLYPWRRYRDFFGPIHNVLKGPDFDLVGVNTARGIQARANWSKGAISRRQASDAVAALGPRDPSRLRLVALHHPLIEMLGGPMTGKVHGGSWAADAFAHGHVDLVLSGHLHAPFALPYACGDGRTVAVGGSTLSIRERGVPIGFNRIEAEGDCIRIVALAWTGSHFEPWRTWAFDKRP